MFLNYTEAILRFYCMFITVNGHPMQASGDQIQFTQRATDPLLSMINGSDQTTTQPTQVMHQPLTLNTDLSFSLFCFGTF